MTELSIIYKHQLSIKKINQPMRSRENAHHSEVCGRPFSSDKHLDCPRLIKAGSQYIYSNKKETSDFHGTVSFDPVKMLQQK